MSKPTPEELLAAWAHRPAELSPEERREVEALLARSPEAAREVESTRDLLQRVEEMPAEGAEPVWDDLERSIRAACVEEPPGWWARALASLRGWKPAAGLGAGLAVAMAAMLLWMGRGERDVVAPVAGVEHDGEVAPEVALAIAGLEAGPVAGAEEPDYELALAPETDAELADFGAPSPDDGLLTEPDLAWLDTLDDAEIDQVAAWLDAQEPS
jgi:anti-sigma factor RsiW